MRKGVVIVDVDDVVANLGPTWVRRFLTKAPACPDPMAEVDWEKWDVGHRVPEEHHPVLWETLSAELYLEVPAVDGALRGIAELRRRGHRVVFATSCAVNHAGAKLLWLARHRFLEGVHFQQDYVECSDKSLLRGDLIIDDRPATCQKFQQVQGPDSAVLFKRTFATRQLPEAVRPGLLTADDWRETIALTDYLFRSK